jgi:hypothetical protein
LTKTHAQYLLGDFMEMAAARSVSANCRAQIIREAKEAIRPGGIARKYALPKATVHRWLRGDFSHVGGDGPCIKSDSKATAGEKRRCLELYYLGCRNAEQTAQTLGLSPETVTHIVDDFEKRAAVRGAD